MSDAREVEEIVLDSDASREDDDGYYEEVFIPSPSESEERVPLSDVVDDKVPLDLTSELFESDDDTDPLIQEEEHFIGRVQEHAKRLNMNEDPRLYTDPDAWLFGSSDTPEDQALNDVYVRRGVGQYAPLEVDNDVTSTMANMLFLLDRADLQWLQGSEQSRSNIPINSVRVGVPLTGRLYKYMVPDVFYGTDARYSVYPRTAASMRTYVNELIDDYTLDGFVGREEVDSAEGMWHQYHIGFRTPFVRNDDTDSVTRVRRSGLDVSSLPVGEQHKARVAMGRAIDRETDSFLRGAFTRLNNVRMHTDGPIDEVFRRLDQVGVDDDRLLLMYSYVPSLTCISALYMSPHDVLMSDYALSDGPSFYVQAIVDVRRAKKQLGSDEMYMRLPDELLTERAPYDLFDPSKIVAKRSHGWWDSLRFKTWAVHAFGTDVLTVGRENPVIGHTNVHTAGMYGSLRSALFGSGGGSVFAHVCAYLVYLRFSPIIIPDNVLDAAIADNLLYVLERYDPTPDTMISMIRRHPAYYVMCQRWTVVNECIRRVHRSMDSVILKKGDTRSGKQKGKSASEKEMLRERDSAIQAMRVEIVIAMEEEYGNMVRDDVVLDPGVEMSRSLFGAVEYGKQRLDSKKNRLESYASIAHSTIGRIATVLKSNMKRLVVAHEQTDKEDKRVRDFELQVYADKINRARKRERAAAEMRTRDDESLPVDRYGRPMPPGASFVRDEDLVLSDTEYEMPPPTDPPPKRKTQQTKKGDAVPAPETATVKHPKQPKRDDKDDDKPRKKRK